MKTPFSTLPAASLPSTPPNPKPNTHAVSQVLKALAGHPIADLLRVTFAEYVLRPSGASMPPHSHEEFQFELITGIGHCTLNHRQIAIKDAVFLLIPPGISHSFVAGRESSLKHLTVKFRALSPTIGALPPLALESPNRNFVQHLQDQMRRMVEEWQIHQWGYELSACLRVGGILIDALRLWQQPWTDGPTGILEDACRYMALHHGRPLSTSEVARHCGLRTDSLCRLFRKNLRTTPGRYLLTARLRHAQALLRAGFSVTHAAERSGFSSIHYFSRVFHAHMKVSPSDWVQRGAGVTVAKQAATTLPLPQSV